MNKKIVDFIHVGDYKTGTSWLQEKVFPFHPEMQYLGDYFKNKEQQRILREIVDTRDLDFDGESLKKRFLDNFQKEENKIVGISREGLSQLGLFDGENAKRIAQRLYDVFGKTKIIYVIREQESMLNSLYSQYVKMGGTRSFKDFFLDPAESRGLIERLKYHKNIKMYQDIFGKENVLVLIYEELKENKKTFLYKTYDFIGCKNKEYIPLNSEKKVNSSLTTYGVYIERQLNKLIRNYHHKRTSSFLDIDKLIYFLLPEKIKDRRAEYTLDYVIPSYNEIDKKQRILYSINMGLTNKFSKFCEKINIGKTYLIDKQIVNQILPLFKESNQKLQNEYNFDVKKYKWTL